MIIKTKKLRGMTPDERLLGYLVEDFNRHAKSLGLKYKLEVHGLLPELVLPGMFGLGNSLGEHHFCYCRDGEYFYIFGGTNQETFNAIKPILEKLKQKFVVELI